MQGVSRTKTFEEAEAIVKSVETDDKEDTRYDRALKVVEATCGSES